MKMYSDMCGTSSVGDQFVWCWWCYSPIRCLIYEVTQKYIPRQKCQ